MPARTITTDVERDEAAKWIRSLNTDKPWLITIERPKKKRSLSQNALMWKWLEEAGAELGYDRQDLHEAIKEHCDCPTTAVNLNGTVHHVRSTRLLSTKDMNDYLDRVYRFLVGEMGMYLTLPTEIQRHG